MFLVVCCPFEGINEVDHVNGAALLVYGIVLLNGFALPSSDREAIFPKTVL